MVRAKQALLRNEKNQYKARAENFDCQHTGKGLVQISSEALNNARKHGNDYNWTDTEYRR